MTSDILIKGGRVINPTEAGSTSNGKAQGSLANNQVLDVRIQDGKITELASELKPREGEAVIDAQGLWVMPGFIDMHTHLRDLGQADREDIYSGTGAAAAGGYTTVVAMANTDPPTDCAEILDRIIKRIHERALIEVLPVASVTKGLKGLELTNMVEMADMGAIAFSDDGMPISNLGVLKRALEYARLHGKPIISHPEDKDLSHGGSMNEGAQSTCLGMKGIPSASEAACVAREIEVLRYTGGRLHFAHISAQASIDLIRQAKLQGLNVTADATPHHLVLSDSEMAPYDTSFKMNPPLRSKKDVEAIEQALLDGVIDAIATDHAPHSKLDKSKPFDHAPFGIVGLETAFSLIFEKLVLSGKMPPPKFLALITTQPAKILGIPAPIIAPGARANIAMVDPELRWTFELTDSFSKSKNSPFVSKQLKGKNLITIFNGKIVYLDKKHAKKRQPQVFASSDN